MWPVITNSALADMLPQPGHLTEVGVIVLSLGLPLVRAQGLAPNQHFKPIPVNSSLLLAIRLCPPDAIIAISRKAQL